ncbi:MAG: class I SAM-dependent methyltransferase [Cyanobacteria bacterium P01_D01_bin.123]
MDRTAKFWDNIARRYSNQPVADEASYQKKLEVTRGYLKPGMEIFEFGCGTGSTAIVHAPHVKHVRAIDVSENMLEIARGKAETEYIENISFERSTIEDIDIPAGSIDVVLGLSILHLLSDKEAAIAKVYTALKPGGIFVTSTACLGDSMSVFKFIAPIGHFLGLIPLVKVFTVAELKTSLTDANFDIDYQWQPSKGKAVFIVAKKPAS